MRQSALDPDLLDLRVVQVALQRPEACDPVQHVADDGLRVPIGGSAEFSDRSE
jgi:hypothetical protein